MTSDQVDPQPHSVSISDMTPPAAPFLNDQRPASRPLSEISDNSDNRRSIARSLKGDGKSRPTSEVREENENEENEAGQAPQTSGPSTSAASAKRTSTPGPVQTITVNLNDYAAMTGKRASGSLVTAAAAPPPPSPTTKPTKPEKPPALVSRRSATSVRSSGSHSVNTEKGDNAKKSDTGDDHVSPLLVSKRASLRPSPLSFSYADVAKPTPSPTTPTTASSLDSSHPPNDHLSNKPLTRTKPSWLRRASGTAALRSKSKSPANDEGTLTASSSLPPALPARKGSITPSVSMASMAPPELPSRGSYANVAATGTVPTAAGPSRSRLGDGQGRPAFSPPAPPLPSRENVGNIRNRLAAWTQAAQSSSSFTRSESSASLASTSTSNPSAFANAQQRFPASAQRVLGHAGSAVQKSWAGLRARGVAGSISGMSSLGGGSGARRGSLEPSPSWSSGLASRGSRDRTQSADVDIRNDGPIFEEGVIKRSGGKRTGQVFGRDIVESGRIWGVADIGVVDEVQGEYEKGRRACLPAVVIRSVEYLEIWSPKEEGIFRISGRTSHISRLKKEFDSGADLDLRECHPADLDPHAVSGLFKSYLRELPAPLLTNALTPRFEAYVRNQHKGDKIEEGEDLKSLLSQLPYAHWFLLSDIVKLLELVPKHKDTNRMTLNALMLSLGPSLNISGGVLTELLEKREELFAVPPPLTAEATAANLDFGDVDIAPPDLPARQDLSRSTTPMSQLTEESVSLVDVKPRKKGPRLPQKPSITRLLSAASGLGSASKQASMETLQSSIVDVEPPRVDVPLSPTSPLPSFQEVSPAVDTLVAENKEPMENLRSPEKKDGSELDSIALGVETNSKPPTTPTPIADKFASNGASFPSLRAPRSSSGSAISTQASLDSGNASKEASPGTSNPATVIRRGAPVFFSSSVVAERSHGRSHSVAAGPVLGSAGTGAGTKRKEEESPPGRRMDDGEGEARKRLSAGPGVLAA